MQAGPALTGGDTEMQTAHVKAHQTPGFTMVEMLVVIAIIAMLAGILIPTIHHAQIVARKGITKNETQSLAMGMEAYFNDWRAYPPDQNAVLGLDSAHDSVAIARPCPTGQNGLT